MLLIFGIMTMTYRKSAPPLQRMRERTFDVGLTLSVLPWTLDAYDPLLDEYLQGYFSNPVMRKHLHQLGLVGQSPSLRQQGEVMTHPSTM